MIVKLYLDASRDRELIDAIEAMPKGERSTRLKGLLLLALSGTGGLLVRIDGLEQRVHALEEKAISEQEDLQPSESGYGADAMHSLLNGLEDG
ncbi:MAG: hypothetical protein C7B43_20195 [Sulfobacillus benefaciens]|uniref:Uncharacterized protein n=1 Tax=Sulfobacillus benefaciens TaxID=453960 RepID=A0A2T2WM69_9FIRM|nr:MAG: hypothetical protein C7B43_20195 [Sulfobacillus benefaciens]